MTFLFLQPPPSHMLDTPAFATSLKRCDSRIARCNSARFIRRLWVLSYAERWGIWFGVVMYRQKVPSYWSEYVVSPHVLHVFSFVHHLHRSSPSFLLAPSYILLYPIFVQGSIQLAVVDWFQVHPISVLGLEHLRATRSKQNQHRGSWKMSKARVISTNCWNW